jgi:exonuclease III
MRIMFWNVRGLEKSHRRGMILNHILQEDLDVVAVQETIKLDFLDKELKEMSGTSIFNWFWIPAKGHSGGLLLGVKDDSYEVEDVNKAKFFLGVLVRHR